ncbi:MAG TPA: hypothetical protein DCS93_11205 [Microscillaceae bacterium]|nr:hypothetical protein [Microscillaceae bacterium]
MSYHVEAYLVDAQQLATLTEGNFAERAHKEFPEKDFENPAEYQELMKEIKDDPGAYLEGCVEGILKDVYLFEHTANFAQQLDNSFADEIKQGSPNVRQALTTLIKGEAAQVTAWEQMYGYAFQLMCESYGQALTNEGFINVNSVEFLVDLEVFSAKVLNFRVYDELFAMPPALPLPLSEYPMIGFLPLQNAKKIAHKFNQLNLEHPDFGEALTTLQSWVDHMLIEKRDLMTFFY